VKSATTRIALRAPEAKRHIEMAIADDMPFVLIAICPLNPYRLTGEALS
jgi:hypothetical protein